MAGPGTYSAYRQLKPLEGDISQDIQQQEENGFRRRTLKLAEDKAEQDNIRTQKEDEEKQISRASSRVKGMGLWDMSSTSGNDVIRKGLAIATEEIGKWGIIRDNPKSTLAQRIEAESKIEALQKFPDNAKVVTDALKNEWDEYKKMVLTGKWRRDPGYEERYQNGYKDIQMSVDDNMQPVVIYGGKLIDRNGDGQINNFDADSLETLKDVSKRPQFKTIYNEADMIKEDLLKVKPFKNTETNGEQEVTTTGLEPEILQSVVNSRFFKEDGSATPELESLAIDRDINLTDKAGLDKIISDYKNKIIFGTPRGVEKKDLYNKLDLQKEQRQAAKDARAERKEDEKTGVESTTTTFDSSLRKDDFTGKVLSKGAVKNNMIGIKGENLKFKNLGGAKSGLNDGFITGFALDSNNNIIVTGKALINKGEKYKNNSEDMFSEGGQDPTLDSYSTSGTYGNFRRIVKSTELSDLATRAGYQNVEALRSELKKMNAKTTSSNKIKINY